MNLCMCRIRHVAFSYSVLDMQCYVAYCLCTSYSLVIVFWFISQAFCLISDSDIRGRGKVVYSKGAGLLWSFFVQKCQTFTAQSFSDVNIFVKQNKTECIVLSFEY